MKTTMSKIRFALFAALTLTLVNCSKGGGGGSSSNTCSNNQISTAAGCLASCGTSNGVNMVMYNGVCTLSTSVTATGSNGTSCGPNMLTYNGQCLQMCGTMSVLQNGQCIQITNSIGGLVNGSTSSNVCSLGCGTGQVQTALGCMPQYSCGTCYGYNNGYCYIGTAAHQYYGY